MNGQRRFLFCLIHVQIYSSVRLVIIVSLTLLMRMSLCVFGLLQHIMFSVIIRKD